MKARWQNNSIILIWLSRKSRIRDSYNYYMLIEAHNQTNTNLIILKMFHNTEWAFCRVKIFLDVTISQVIGPKRKGKAISIWPSIFCEIESFVSPINSVGSSILICRKETKSQPYQFKTDPKKTIEMQNLDESDNENQSQFIALLTRKFAIQIKSKLVNFLLYQLLYHPSNTDYLSNWCRICRWLFVVFLCQLCKKIRFSTNEAFQ